MSSICANEFYYYIEKSQINCNCASTVFLSFLRINCENYFTNDCMKSAKHVAYLVRMVTREILSLVTQ